VRSARGYRKTSPVTMTINIPRLATLCAPRDKGDLLALTTAISKPQAVKRATLRRPRRLLECPSSRPEPAFGGVREAHLR
jgi:hypothetical protein